jgi:CubicO group peptidase (beta-lactamase class C family)
MSARRRGDVDIEGWTAPNYEAVREVFAANFTREDDAREAGAAVAAFQDGRCVVDLWGGMADPAAARPWTRDTLANIWSTTKGVTALAAAKLVDAGHISYGTRVADVWPEFARNGKADVTLAHLLSHQAGLPGFAEPTRLEDQCDWEGCCDKLARQAPAWAPGTATSYHAATFGWLVGEVVRRVSGSSFGAFVRREIARPLKADVHIGLSATCEAQVARMLAPRGAPPPMDAAPAALMALENPVQDPEAPNARAWRAAEMPALNGQASALGLARLYASVGSENGLDGRRTVSAAAMEAMTRPATTGRRRDMLMGLEDSWGMGFMLNPLQIYGPGARAFGHSGWGGSFACADPELGLSIGYVCNQMGSALLADPRSTALSAAVTACAARARTAR